MKRTPALYVILLAFHAWGRNRCSSRKLPVKTTLCELAEHPEQYARENGRGSC